MSSSEGQTTNAHKRTASSTSPVQTASPPHKRPTTTTLTGGAAKREFPHVIFLVLWKDEADTTVLAAHAGLRDANAEARALGLDQGLPISESDDEPLRWETAEGVTCWVEVHAIKPKTLPKSPVMSGVSGAHEPVLYDPAEDDERADDNEENAQYD